MVSATSSRGEAKSNPFIKSSKVSRVRSTFLVPLIGVAVGNFMGVGKKDEARFVYCLEDMARKLKSRNYQDFRLKSKVYGSEDHMSIVTPAVWAGLMWVFGE